MKSLIYAGAAALALTAAPAMADHHMEPMELTAMQQSMYDAWDAEQQATYDAWPMEAQTYYWTLDEMQQGVWWNALNNEQRVSIVTMTEPQRVAAWTSIRNQMNAAGNATASNASATARTTRSATSGNIVFRGNAVTLAHVPLANHRVRQSLTQIRQMEDLHRGPRLPWVAG